MNEMIVTAMLGIGAMSVAGLIAIVIVGSLQIMSEKRTRFYRGVKLTSEPGSFLELDEKAEIDRIIERRERSKGQ